MTPLAIKAASSIWITGLSSSGKSTVADLLMDRLRAHAVPCILLDGDQIRQVFEEKLGYDVESRRKQTHRVLRVARLAASQGILPVVAIIHPFAADRQLCRESMPGGYHEVHLKCALSVCVERDSRLGKKVYTGANVVGVDIPYDEPQGSELTIETDRVSPAEALELLWRSACSSVWPLRGRAPAQEPAAVAVR